eukprot:scaffold2139_cov109-Isochrysis_galbana.AAC.1
MSLGATASTSTQGCRVTYQSDAIWALITDISTDISLISDMWPNTKPAMGCARNVSDGLRTNPRTFWSQWESNLSQKTMSQTRTCSNSVLIP